MSATTERQGSVSVSSAVEDDDPIDRFDLPSGHRVAVFRPGDLGVPLHFDHRLVLLEDTGSRESNRAAALAALASQKP